MVSVFSGWDFRLIDFGGAYEIEHSTKYFVNDQEISRPGVNAPKYIHLNVYICNFVQVFVIRYGVTANITAFHAVARGSIPRTGIS